MPEGKRELIVDIFLRPDGLLRPGWRFLLYVLIGFALFYFFGLLGDLWRQMGIGAIWRGPIAEASLVVAVFLPALIMARIHWHALRLWLKRLAIVPKPAPPRRAVSGTDGLVPPAPGSRQAGETRGSPTSDGATSIQNPA